MVSDGQSSQTNCCFSIAYMQVHIRQARIADKGSEFHDKIVDIIIKDGIISKVTPVSKPGTGSVEVDGTKVLTLAKGKQLSISAGWVDLVADYSEPGYEHKETIATGLAAAAAGGFTDVCVVPNTNPTGSTKSIIDFLLKKATGNVVSLHPLGSISQNIEGKSLAEMMDMHAHGAVAFTDGWKPVQTAGLMLKAMEYVKAFDGVLLQLPEDTSIAAGGLMHEGIVSTRLGMPGVPAEAETIIINRDLQLLRYTGSKLHITGISTAEGVDLVRRAKKEKLNVTCSVTPYHLALTDESLVGYDSMYKVSPPLRSEKDRQALIKGLKDGTIDCITSHHHPQDWDAKVREFEYAAYGMNIQELAFSIAMQGVADKVEEARVIDAFSSAPRRILGWPELNIAKGNKASLTLYTTEEHTVVGKMQSSSENHPFSGKELPGRVIGIVNNNQVSIKN